MAKWYQKAIIVWPPGGAEDLCHAHGEGRRAAGTREDGGLADVLGLCVMASGVITKPQLEMTCAALRRGAAHDGGRRVHREVDARFQHAGGGDRHQRDEATRQHAAEAHQPHVRFLLQHLGRRARGDQRVEAGHGAARDGDEEEREQLAGEHRAGAVDERA
jgi:hypothetical protein